MKVVKISKRLLNKAPQDLLTALGAVDLEKKQAYPEKVFMSKEDYRTLRANTRKRFKKEFPYLTKRGIDNGVGFELLNYGPNETLASAIRPGYVLIKD